MIILVRHVLQMKKIALLATIKISDIWIQANVYAKVVQQIKEVHYALVVILAV